ncbi:transmembrane protein 181-like isoform X2 [Mya arenaria]|uniref:transmembrane protein 181-like isoform X2 n=1 Tax=Mya arenaria TaxID=6604 RepID=UPI0022DFA8A3|nr:transmembrane protein 181-like isoform X2 [Mya arenaria]XP_052811614.1 transmembrane protein 181-like isoform X2 [Mya arenaria]
MGNRTEIESSVQMRLYSLNKRQFVMVFVTFLMCFGITVLIGIAGPPIIETVSYNLSAMTQGDPNINMKTGPFALKSPPLTTFHQQFWLVAHIITDNTEGTRIEQSFTVSVFIGGIKAEDSSLLQGDNPVLDGLTHNRTRLLSCTQECRDLILLHLGYLDYTSYVINVNFHGLEQQAHFNIKNIIFYFKSYNTAFTKLEIWLRFSFLAVTFIATCMFSHSLRKFSMRDWSIEQKWMSVLMPLLLLYNDPLFPLTFLVNSWIPGMFDAIFQSSFLCGLLLFWLCIYHGVRQTDRRFWKFYSLKVLIVGLIWISAVTLSSWQEYNELQDPTYFYRLDTSNFMGFKIFFFIVGGIYLLYLLYLLVRAYAELRSMPYFDLRLKFMTLLMLIVLSISITITVLRFGRAALQDNFVAELSTHYQNSAEFVAFYGLLNTYMFTMAFVYSPPPSNNVFETHFKDNPGLSMLNDSDEEVHYGSDTESVGLTRIRPTGKYDSD